jgi:hypothetical protein
VIAQLDPGFTGHGFLANFAIQVLATFAGTVGAFVVALLIYRKQSKDDRATFEETLTHQRKLLQDQFAHDLEMRRREDEKRQRERDVDDDAVHWQTLRRIAREIDYNSRLTKQIGRGAGLIGLRSDSIERLFALSKPLPDSVEYKILQSLYAVDRYNWQAEHGDDWIAAGRDARDTLEEARQVLAEYLRSEGYDWSPIAGPDNLEKNSQ